ncbi:MAG: hypothetical protein JO236_09440 [Mycobacterium sp.]|nr:hypothetical protein [Mycobacterium sp.]
MVLAPASASSAVDNRVAFLDHASLLRLRATGFETVAQVTWVYDRAVDMDRLRQFNQNLGYGLLGRRIERSPLPFGRPRWVAYHEPTEIDIAPAPRPRAEVGAWKAERAQVPVNPEHGPCWHLAVLPLEDGGTAVTMVSSHTVVDGIALGISIYEAIHDIRRDLGYPPPRSRSRRQGLLADALDTIRGLPQVVLALVACIMILLKSRKDAASQTDLPRSAKTNFGDEPIEVPSVTLCCDLDAWDARALEFGGSSNSLFIAFAARLAQHLGRVSPVDGAVTITVPVSERGPDDVRGNALTAATFRLDPDRAATDLQVVGNEMKRSLAALEHTPNELLKPLPLVPFTPKWAVRRLEGMAIGGADLPVCCSNVRQLTEALKRIDGADCDYGYARLFNQGATKQRMENAGGELYLFSGRVNGQIFISVSAYQPGAENSNENVRELIEQTLADYGLTAARYE